MFFLIVTFSTIPTASATNVDVGTLPFEVAINEETERAYVSQIDGEVHVIKTDTKTFETIIDTGSGVLTGIGIDPLTERIFTVNGVGNELIVIDGDPLSGTFHTVLATIPLFPFGGVFPVDVEVNPFDRTVYVSNVLSLVVLVFNVDTFAPVGAIIGFDSPARFTFDPDTELMYMTNFFLNEVSVIKTSDNSILDRIIVGNSPDGIEILESTKKIYSANSAADTVSVIDVDPGSDDYNTVIKTIDVGVNPVGVGVNEAINEIYVANRDEGYQSLDHHLLQLIGYPHHSRRIFSLYLDQYQFP